MKNTKNVDYFKQPLERGLYFILDGYLVKPSDVFEYLGLDINYKGVGNLKYILADFKIDYETVMLP